MNITVYEILNDFFGHGVTVSGLITGQDLIKQLRQAIRRGSSSSGEYV